MKQVTENLEKELALFGLTLNQTKIYLTIVRARSITASDIAQITKLHRQDIYKIVPKLQKMGLVTKTLGKPVRWKALNAEFALENLVSAEEKRFLERKKQMNSALKKTVDAICKLQRTENIEQVKVDFSLLDNESEIVNKCDDLFQNASVECSVVLDMDFLERRGELFRVRFQNATKNGAETRLLVEAPVLDDRLYRLIERVRPKSKQFSAKFVKSKSSHPYILVDSRHTWIARHEQLPSGAYRILLTTSPNIREVYQERFDNDWNSPDSVTVSPQKEIRESSSTLRNQSPVSK